MKLLSFTIFLSLLACGADDESNSTDEAISDSKTPAMMLVSQREDLGECVEEIYGAIYYVEDEEIFFHCSEIANNWTAIDLQGEDGKDGVDGKDGKDGEDGKDGVDGKDGANTSVVSQGSTIDAVYSYQDHDPELDDELTELSYAEDPFQAWISDVRLVYFTSGDFQITISGYTLEWVEDTAGDLVWVSTNFTHSYLGKGSADTTYFEMKILDYEYAVMQYEVGPASSPSFVAYKNADGVDNTSSPSIFIMFEE